MNILLEAIRKRIIEKMREREMTQSELARITGRSQEFINGILNNNRGMSFDTADKIMHSLGLVFQVLDEEELLYIREDEGEYRLSGPDASQPSNKGGAAELLRSRPDLWKLVLEAAPLPPEKIREVCRYLAYLKYEKEKQDAQVCRNSGFKEKGPPDSS